MKIYNSTNTSIQFGAKFNNDHFFTKRALNCLKREITIKKDEAFFNDFISQITNNKKNDILELTQFDKYYLISSNLNNKTYKIRNNNIIENLNKFLLHYNK